MMNPPPAPPSSLREQRGGAGCVGRDKRSVPGGNAGNAAAWLIPVYTNRFERRWKHAMDA